MDRGKLRTTRGIEAVSEQARSSLTRRRALLVAALGLPAPRLRAQARVFRIGLLGGSSPSSPAATHIWAAFFARLRELGYAEGRNVVFENRFYGDRIEQLPALAAELARLRVDVIVAGNPPAPEEAARATSTIPIVFANHTDPVASGLVASLAKPGGNVTGISLSTTELRAKQLQLLQELLGRVELVAVLHNPTVPGHALDLRLLEEAARKLKIRLLALPARGSEDFAGAFAAAVRSRCGAVLGLGGSAYHAHRETLVRLAIDNRLPSMWPFGDYPRSGGLLSYGPDIPEAFRRAAGYVAKILEGARPADLPVEQPTKLHLVINLGVARALGITIPPSVRLRADELIE